jgi:flagellar biosynthesis chaperone FliJ
MGKPWTILEKLASIKLMELNRSLNEVDARLRALEARRSQILGLVAQNRERLSGKNSSCSMGEVQVITVFLRNLGAALHGTDQEISELEQEKGRISKEFQEKLKEKNKMASLMEREVKKETQKLEIADQKRMNEAGIKIHNLKNA